MEPLSHVRLVLVCEECGGYSYQHERGWRAALVTDPEGADDDEIAVYCPSCWENEFQSGQLGA